MTVLIFLNTFLYFADYIKYKYCIFSKTKIGNILFVGGYKDAEKEVLSVVSYRIILYLVS